MKNGTGRQPACAWAIERVHLRLDADGLSSGELALLERHLARCPDCRVAATELERLQASLRDLTEIPLPDAALERVWRRTTRRYGWLANAFRPLPRWGLAAAAATLALVLIGIWSVPPTEVAPLAEGTREAVGTSAPASEQDVQRAVAELKMVFGVTAQALHRTETTLDEVLVDRVSPVLTKTRLPWFRQAKGKDDV